MQGNGIDLAELDVKTGSEAGFKLELRHPTTRQPIGVWILILGSDSDAYQEQTRAVQRRWAESMKQNQRAELTEEEKEQQGRDLLVSITRSWSENMKLDGELLPFSAENARRLYADKRLPWIPEQVYREVHNRANFLRANGSGS